MFQSIIARLLANKHTTGAAIALFIIELAIQIGPIWFPAHTEQFRQTGNALEKMAMAYGFIMSADSKAGAPPPAP